MSLSDEIRIDPERVCNEIEEFIRKKMEDLERDGLLIGLSGGLDSCVVTTLCTRAVGRKKVHAIYMPDKNSDPAHGKDAFHLARSLGITFQSQPLTKQLRTFSVYRLMPISFFPRKFKAKLVRKGFRYYEKTVGASPFATSLKGLKDKKFSSLLAKGNAYYRIKHRLRMLRLYLTAEINNLLVVGCANRTEHLIGYFVKFGCDHAADIMPILNLYKLQVFMLAEYLKIAHSVITKAPFPDVIPGISDEDAIGMPYKKLDLILLGLEKQYSLPQIIAEAEVSREEIEKVKQLLERSQHMREIYVPGAR